MELLKRYGKSREVDIQRTHLSFAMTDAKEARLQRAKVIGFIPAFVETTDSVSFGLFLGGNSLGSHHASHEDYHFFPSPRYFSARRRYNQSQGRDN